MKINTIGLILIFSSLYNYSFSQIDHIIWQRCLGTSHYDFVHAVERCNSGYLVGISVGTNDTGISNYHGKGDAWIVCLDSTGNIIWERCYGGSQSDSPVKILRVDDNTFYLLNFSMSNDGDVQNNREGEVWVVKIDSLGNIVWENC